MYGDNEMSSSGLSRIFLSDNVTYKLVIYSNCCAMKILTLDKEKMECKNQNVN